MKRNSLQQHCKKLIFAIILACFLGQSAQATPLGEAWILNAEGERVEEIDYSDRPLDQLWNIQPDWDHEDALEWAKYRAAGNEGGAGFSSHEVEYLEIISYFTVDQEFGEAATVAVHSDDGVTIDIVDPGGQVTRVIDRENKGQTFENMKQAFRILDYDFHPGEVYKFIIRYRNKHFRTTGDKDDIDGFHFCAYKGNQTLGVKPSTAPLVTLKDGDNLYIKMGALNAKMTLTAVVDQGTLTNPTWQGKPANEPKLTISIDTASATKAGTAYTVTSGNLSATINVIVVDLKITTTGDLEIYQEDGRHKIEIFGRVKPTDLPIKWQLSNNFHPKTVIAKQKNEEAPGAGKYKTTVFLHRKTKSWETWKRIEKLVVRLVVPGTGKAGRWDTWIDPIDDLVGINAYKFERYNTVSKGSKPFSISLLGENPSKKTSIGYLFNTTTDGDPYNWITALRSMTSKWKEQLPKSQIHPREKKWELYYQSSSDSCNGKYSMSEVIKFTGILKVKADYYNNIFNKKKKEEKYQATIAVVAACIGRVDNTAVTIPNNTLGIRHSGHPVTITIDNNLNVGTTGVGVGTGKSVTMSPTTSDNMSLSTTPKETFVFKISDKDHKAGGSISHSKLIKCIVRIYMNQTGAKEWTRFAYAGLTAKVPVVPKIIFKPTM